MFIIIVFSLGLIYWDSRVLRRMDGGVFRHAFAMSYPLAAGVVVVMLAAVVRPQEWSQPFFVVVVFLGFAVYLLRRERFLKIRDRHQIGKETQFLRHPKPIWCLSLTSDALGVILHWLGLMIIVTFVMKTVEVVLGVADDESVKLTQMVFFATCSSAVLLFLIARASRRFSPEGFLTNVALVRGGHSPLRTFVIPILLGIFFACMAVTLALIRDVQPVTPLEEILSASDSPLALLTFLVLAVFVAPLIEEIIFRGYFFRILSEVKGEITAVYVMALSFGVLHVGQYWGDWLAIAVVFLLGFVLTILRAWTGTTTASVMTHYVYNGGMVFISLII